MSNEDKPVETNKTIQATDYGPEVVFLNEEDRKNWKEVIERLNRERKAGEVLTLPRNMDKNLYQWSSKLLYNYAHGTIVVMATDVAEARLEAFNRFSSYMKERYDYYWDASPEDRLDPLFAESYAEKLALFEADIAAEPSIVQGCLFIEGSN